MATEAGAVLDAPPSDGAAAPVAAPPTAPQPADAASSSASADKASKDKPNDKASKDKANGKDTKFKKAKSGGPKDSKGATEASDSPSVAAHPRAARTVAQAKAWGGLAGFFVAGYFSLPTSTLAEAALRALVAGSVCYVAAWAGAVFVWRRLVMIELKGREQHLLASAQAVLEQGESQDAPGERPRTGAPPQGR